MTDPLWRITVEIDTVISASSGDKAIDQVADLIPVDLEFKGSDGLSLPFELRSIEAEETREEEWPRV